MMKRKENMMLICFFHIFEKYREASQNEIDSLIQENIKLNNEIKANFSMLTVYLEKSEDIIQLANQDEAGVEQSVIDNCIEKEMNDNKLIVSAQKTGKLLEDLNLIRDIVVDAFSKLKIKEDHIANLRNKLNTTSLLTNIIANKTFIFKKSFFDLLPKWMPDDVVNRCMNCEKRFGLCTWKYHCRVCGGVYCSTCSANYDNFLPFYVDEVRMCNGCFSVKKYKTTYYEINYF